MTDRLYSSPVLDKYRQLVDSDLERMTLDRNTPVAVSPASSDKGDSGAPRAPREVYDILVCLRYLLSEDAARRA
ncbi:hypothetical protein LMJ38_23865 [Streptomyces sp. R1]|uniref:hypothetical protein n=1 Tax=Streptomyces sp. R1 TaxID=1509279 RepID=UPI001E397C55|nr:hypothetical protein [Streptomyces sp. R1]MCC8338960.1 hypothetical protein [Streptomyces sp. R1]